MADELIDYANPMILAERCMRRAHDCFLQHDYDVGIEFLNNAIANTRLARAAAQHMKEQRDALRQQTASV